MDLLSTRQKLVASNMANIDTPGYKAKDIDFQFEFLSPSFHRDSPPNVVDAPGFAVKSDGNNVSLDRETRLFSENALRFSVASNLMKAQLKIVESAIKEGQSWMSLMVSRALSVSASGMAAQRSRAELLVQNMANSETTRTPEGGPYRRRDVVFQSAPQTSPFSAVFQTR